jgi:hypothetical protein
LQEVVEKIVSTVITTATAALLILDKNMDNEN